MAKLKSVYVCSECGYESPKWYGKCPGCGEWNTMNEELPASSATSRHAASHSSVNQVMALGEITEDVEKRMSTGIRWTSLLRQRRCLVWSPKRGLSQKLGHFCSLLAHPPQSICSPAHPGSL